MLHCHYSEWSGNRKTVKKCYDPPQSQGRALQWAGSWERATSAPSAEAAQCHRETLLPAGKQTLWSGTKLHCPLIHIQEISTMRATVLSVNKRSQKSSENSSKWRNSFQVRCEYTSSWRCSLLGSPPVSGHYAQVWGSLPSPLTKVRVPQQTAIVLTAALRPMIASVGSPQLFPCLLFHPISVLKTAVVPCSAVALHPPTCRRTPENRISEIQKALRQTWSHYIIRIYCDDRTVPRLHKHNIT